MKYKVTLFAYQPVIAEVFVESDHPVDAVKKAHEFTKEVTGTWKPNEEAILLPTYKVEEAGDKKHRG